MRSHVHGAILGEIIGDALGTRYEFSSSDNAQKVLREDCKHGFLNILGGGPFEVIPGQVTDDTELTMALWYAILEKKHYDKETVAKKYIEWYKSNPFDIGNTTKNAFDKAYNYESMINNTINKNSSSLSNGCIMRISPLAIYGLRLSNEKLMEYVEQEVRMTHSHPLAIEMSKVYVFAIRVALENNSKKFIFSKIYQYAKHPYIKQLIINSLKSPFPLNLDSFQGKNVNIHSQSVHQDTVHNDENQGYIGIALQNALYELFAGFDFYQSMINILMRGGDTDTNCCIAGALLGAYYGLSKIPSQWIEQVKINNPRSQKYKYIDQTKIDQLCINIDELLTGKIN